MKRNSPRKILGLYFDNDEELKKDYRDIMLDKYLEEADEDLFEALGMMRFRLDIAEQEEAYEECAIIKDVLKEFGHVFKD